MRFDETYSLEEGMKRFKGLLDEYDSLYKSKKLPDDDAIRLSKDARYLISILHDRHEYWDHRRERFLQIGLGMVAFSIAVIGALAAVFDKLIAYWVTFILMGIVFLVMAGIIIGGIQLIRIWNRQNNPDYPFTKGHKIWRWQYRYAEETQRPFKYRYNTKTEFEEDIEVYIRNLHSYARRTLDLKPMEILEQDISQLFLLIENEKYKIKFVSELRNTFVRWLTVAFGVGVVAVFIFAAVVYFGAYEIITASLTPLG